MTYCLDSYNGNENWFYCFDSWGVGSGNVKAFKCVWQRQRILKENSAKKWWSFSWKLQTSIIDGKKKCKKKSRQNTSEMILQNSILI